MSSQNNGTLYVTDFLFLTFNCVWLAVGYKVTGRQTEPYTFLFSDREWKNTLEKERKAFAVKCKQQSRKIRDLEIKDQFQQNEV